MTDPSSPEPAPTVSCDHCELRFPIEQARPVVITGGQTYAGHVLRQHGGPRHVWLCWGCYDALQAAHIDWLTIEDDADAIASMGG